MRPSAELDLNLPEGAIAEKVFVEQLETDAQHSQEVLDEDDAFLGASAAEVWEYEVVDACSGEFEAAIEKSDLVLEYDIVDMGVLTGDDAASTVPGETSVYPAVDAEGNPGGTDDLSVTQGNDPRLGLTNRGQKPGRDWAANTGPTRNASRGLATDALADQASTLSPEPSKTRR